ncbi:MAG: hydantoinase/oxoprolinase family protein [Candidatus Hecatellales archaeon]|nr:MAG: hydantoinase/oxoprolinase family protein [Candidatus Hecatellales archaeon]
MSSERRYRLGFDIGGTFTDLVIADEATGEIRIMKVPSTPKNPNIGALQGLRRLLAESGVKAGQLTFAIHGTTVVTNTVIERKGAKTALITTKGFRDVLEIGRERRVTQYDIFEERLPPLVPRYLRREVDERTAFNGEILKELNPKEVEALIRELAELGVESIAVCLLHSYSNPKHEREIEEIASKVSPEIRVSLSSAVLPAWREYERTSTTVVNAYTRPKTEKYMEELTEGLKAEGFKARLFIMTAAGGIIPVETAAKFPVRILESGPAAGTLAATFIGELVGENNLISFDMGGTTAKVALVERGQPRITTVFEVGGYRFKKGSGYPVEVPTIDLIEIGAGGGSIAHVEMGLLKVGPESAGADPGPACYGLGGTQPTVTDADLVLGYLNPDYFIGGEMKLRKDLAIKAIEEHVAKPLGLSVVEAALGIHDVVNANMARAMRAVSIERGKDPRMLTLVAFGGAGPVHANRLAEQNKIRKLVIPLAAGVATAIGMLASDVKFDFVRTYVARIEEVDVDTVKRLYEEMESEAVELLKAAGVTEMELIRSVDMRYVGQAYELNVQFPGKEISESMVKELEASFIDLYEKTYGFTTGDPVEAVNWRVLAVGKVPRVKVKRVTERGKAEDALKGKRKVYFSEYGEYVECDIYDRYRLLPGALIEGPAIVEERESTAVICPKAKATVDEYLNLIITLEEV